MNTRADRRQPPGDTAPASYAIASGAIRHTDRWRARSGAMARPAAAAPRDAGAG